MKTADYPDESGRYVRRLGDEWPLLVPHLRRATLEVARLVAPEDQVYGVAAATYRDMLTHLRDRDFTIVSLANASSDACLGWCPRTRQWKLNWRHIHARTVGWTQRLHSGSGTSRSDV